jgi:molecular chaperone DnaK (HSP70)
MDSGSDSMMKGNYGRKDSEFVSTDIRESETGMEGLWNTFSKQKQLLMNCQNEILSLKNDLKRIENKSQNLLNENQKMIESNEQFEETIEINHELRENLEKDLQELYSSKSNMIITLQAIDTKIHEDQKQSREENEKIEMMIQSILKKVNEQTESQNKEKGKRSHQMPSHLLSAELFGRLCSGSG